MYPSTSSIGKTLSSELLNVIHLNEYRMTCPRRVAKEYGLSLRYKKEFHEIFQEESEDAEFALLLKRMKVVDENGDSAMDEEQWDAASE
jgi:hypothetical protein